MENENVDALKQRVSSSPLCDHVWSAVGDANVQVNEVVKHILEIDREFLPGKWSSLNLAFLDPAGIDLKWSTVEALSMIRKIDLIIYYPQYGLELNMPHQFESEVPTKINGFFGGTEWRKIFAKWRGREHGLHRNLMDHYKDRLKQLGFVEILRDDETEDEPLIRNSQRNAPLYRLLFASKHELGHDFWRKVTRRNVYGQGRLL